MKIKHLLHLAFLASASIFIHHTSAQTTVNFEIDLPGSGYYNGSDGAGGFASGPLYFKNLYDNQFSFWQGFACSAKTDTLTAGFSNQYSAFAGSGAGGSAKFGVGYVVDDIWLKKISPFAGPFILNSFAYTNNTFAALSMRNGDAFSKKFGGPSGNDPDYFKLKIYNYYNGSVSDSAEVFLADFRFSDNSQDYIVKNWRTADLNFTSPFDSIQFKLESSDTGLFGMNTPAYFCIDNLVLGDFNSISPSIKPSKVLYPNPATDFIRIKSAENLDAIVVDAYGKTYADVAHWVGPDVQISLTHLPPGVYRVLSRGEAIGSFIKK